MIGIIEIAVTVRRFSIALVAQTSQFVCYGSKLESLLYKR